MAILLTENRARDVSENFVESVANRADNDSPLFAKKVGLIGKLFGCAHGELSRPFSHGKIGYRSCLKCGAVKQFNPDTLQTFGGFYYSSVINRVEL